MGLQNLPGHEIEWFVTRWGIYCDLVNTEQRGQPFTSPDGEASVGDLVKEITEDLSNLVRKEVELARNEISEVVRTKMLGGALFAIAGVIGVLILPFALLTLIEVFALFLPRWGATLAVTVVMIVLGVVVFFVARKQFKSKMLPTQTIQTIKDDIRWAKDLKK